MARYIDAEWLVDCVNTRQELSVWAKRTEINHIMSAPVVDVVEVVRCKHCKHWKTAKCRIDYTYYSEPKERDFCSYGERKEGR